MPDPLVAKVAEAIEDTQPSMCWGSHEDWREAQARNAIAVVRTYIAADIRAEGERYRAQAEAGISSYYYVMRAAAEIAEGKDA